MAELKVMYEHLPDIKNDLVSVLGSQYKDVIDQRLKNIRFFENLEDSTILDLHNSDLKFKFHIARVYDSVTFLDYFNVLSNKVNMPGLSYISVVNNAVEPIVFIWRNGTDADHCAVHEIVHSIGARVAEEGRIERGLTRTIVNDIDEQEKDSYTLDNISTSGYRNLDEVMTDYIARKVMDNRRSRCAQIMSNVDSQSYYSRAFIIFDYIYNKYKDIFNQAYLTKDFTYLEQCFGKTNVRKLDEGLAEFMELSREVPLGEFSLFSAYDSKIKSGFNNYSFFKDVYEQELDKKFMLGKVFTVGKAKKLLKSFNQSVQIFRDMEDNYNYYCNNDM